MRKRLCSPGQWVKLNGTFVPQFNPHGATIIEISTAIINVQIRQFLDTKSQCYSRGFLCFLDGTSPPDERRHIHGKLAQSPGAVTRRQRCPLTCIVVHVVDLHGRLGSVVAEASVLLQQLQTFIAVKHGAPAVIRTQHGRR